MLINIISRIFVALIPMYLPFDDINLKITMAVLLGELISEVLKYLPKIFNKMPFIFKRKVNYVKISKNSEIYDILMDYYSDKYNKEIKAYNVNEVDSTIVYTIQEFYDNKLYDTYENNGTKFKIMVYFEIPDANNSITNSTTNSTNIAKNEYRDIYIECRCTVDNIKEYINTIIKNHRENMSISRNGKIYNTLNIYNIHSNTTNSKNGSEKNDYKWKHQITITNKTINNTFVSNHVNETLLKDIDFFINNEKYYKNKGYPYKRGYILYGEPGCGKTSIIKIIAQHYKLPVFLVDISIFEQNDNFTKIMHEISNYVELGKPHIVIYEDIDRSSLFNYYYNYHNDTKSKITQDCFLNIIDGIDECYGRITFLTTNDITRVNSVKALLRPGRIDVQVHVTYCDSDQITRIIDNYCDENNADVNEISNKIDERVKITPAVLIHLTKYIKNKQHVILYLNKLIDFTNVTIENIITDIQNTILGNVDGKENGYDALTSQQCTITNDDLAITPSDYKYYRKLCLYKKLNYELDNDIYGKRIKNIELQKELDRIKLQKITIDIQNNIDTHDKSDTILNMPYSEIKKFYNGTSIRSSIFRDVLRNIDNKQISMNQDEEQQNI